MAEEKYFSDFLIESMAKTGIIKQKGTTIIIPEVDTRKMAIEKLSVVIGKLEDLKNNIETNIAKLEDSVVQYNNLIPKIPQIGDFRAELPQDLLENYRKATIEITEAGILRKIRADDKLTTNEQIMLMNWKGLKATMDFIAPSGTKGSDPWEHIQKLHDLYKNLITLSQNSIQNLNYVKEKLDVIIASASGVSELVQTISEMPPGTMNPSNVIGSAMAFLKEAWGVIEFSTEEALNLNKMSSGVEVTNAITDAYAGFVGTVRQEASTAEERGMNQVDKDKLMAELEEAERAIMKEK